MMRTPLIAGNWKMHKTLPEARALVTGIKEGIAAVDGVEVLICPPFQHLFPMAKAIANTKIMLGAQNAHEEPQGAFTGEVSVAMIAETGATHIIIGHSERRHVFGEAGDRLARKGRAVIGGGLTAIYCVGETLDEREGGRTAGVIQRQMAEVVTADLPTERLVIAYEPVWAIGTGKTASPEQAQEVHARIRAWLAETFDPGQAAAIRILYGGSVKPGNAGELLSQSDIDGALVGGACLDPVDFVAIISTASAVTATS